VLAPCRARRWTSGDLIFESVELEGDAEEAVRRAVEERRSIDDVKGVSAALRAAYGLALVLAVARAEGTEISGLEARAAMLDVATGGARAAADLLFRLDERRREESLVAAARAAARQGPRNVRGDVHARAEAALEAAGARFFDARRLAGGMVEVRFEMMG
jgi:hypothetical protein